MKKTLPIFLWFIGAVLVVFRIPHSTAAQSSAVTFPSGEFVLHGDLYQPEGAGPFPGVIWYHIGGSPKISERPKYSRFLTRLCSDDCGRGTDPAI
jgi:hypothetical protein